MNVSRVVLAFRILLLLLIALAAYALLADRRADEPRPAVVIEGAEDIFSADGAVRPWVRGALLDAPPALLTRRGAMPPAPAEMDALAALAGRTTLFAARSEELPALEVEPPPHPRTERAAAIAVRVRGRPGDTVAVRLRDEAGIVDSLRVPINDTGRGSAAFRVRPVEAGWWEWTVETEGAARSTGSWVRTAGPPRVLVAAGPPNWESRFLLRALEASGARVELVQPLGAGLAAGARASLPVSPDELADFDAVLVLAGAEIGPEQRQALEHFVSEAGGGVLAVGQPALAGLLGLGGDVGSGMDVRAAEIAWSLPAELAPLPPADLRLAGRSLPAPPAGAITGAATAEAGLLTLRARGRGRAAAFGLLSTWRWRMEEGRTDEHREFWRSLVDWLAGAPPSGPRIALARSMVPLGQGFYFQIVNPETSDGEAIRVHLVQPDGERRELPAISDADRPDRLRVSVVPVESGVYTVALGDDEPTAAFRATANAQPAGDAWSRLSRAAHASGGGIRPAEGLRAEVRRRTDVEPEPPAERFPISLPVVFVALVLTGGAEWSIRRLSGRA